MKQIEINEIEMINPALDANISFGGFHFNPEPTLAAKGGKSKWKAIAWGIGKLFKSEDAGEAETFTPTKSSCIGRNGGDGGSQCAGGYGGGCTGNTGDAGECSASW